jgi:DNA-binding CsgD family transcriptional regulator
MRSLADIANDPATRTCLAGIAERVQLATGPGDIQSLLHLTTITLGAERSFFASICSSEDEAGYAFVLDCDSLWWHRYRATCPLPENPWLTYATRHSALVLASQLERMAPACQRPLTTAPDTGFTSAVLVPTHSGRLERRASLLCFGHSVAGYFEDSALAMLRVATKSLALEFHEWWASHERQQLVERTSLSEADLRLLAQHCAGLSSKQIACDLQISRESVNSRFQRIIARLGVRNRRAAARVAIDCGLIVM